MSAEVLQMVFKLALIVFMVGNLSLMGLQLKLGDAMAPLRNIRFLALTLLGGFVFSPTLAFLLTLAIPMQRPYAIGLLLLGLAPAAPFLPVVVRMARGDLASTAAFMLLASIGTIICMPIAVPFVAAGFQSDAWSVAKPLVYLVLLPLALGMLIKYLWPGWASALFAYVKIITGIGTAAFLALVLMINFKSFIGAIGSGAFAAQLLFVVGLTFGGYRIAAGMKQEQRSVISLGLCTRNIGAAAAIVGANGDQKIMVMLVIGTLATVGISFGAAAWFARKTLPRQAPLVSEMVESGALGKAAGKR